MSEKQPRSEAKLIQAEQKARLPLQSFLDENYRSIRMLRSYYQHLPHFKKQNRMEELRELEKGIEKGSKGKLHWFDGGLCEISDTGQNLQYHDEFFPKFGEKVKSIRGFHFNFLIGNTGFECVDLDGGRSRQYFDGKNGKEKREFLRRFAERTGDSLTLAYPERLPLAFTAFITDTGRAFAIEELVAYRSFPPRPRQ